MSRLNMVRKIKDAKQIKIKDTYELKREKEWDDRFIYSKFDSNKDKIPLPKKAKNDYSSNIKYLKEQFYSENYKKNNTSNKTRGKSGFKIYKEKNNSNKLKIKGNYLLKNNTNKNDDFHNLNNTEENLQKNSIRISSNDDINIYNNENKYYLMPKEELEICVEILWNKLAVKEAYSIKFNILKKEKGNEETQKDLLIMEIQNLKKMEKFLKNLNENIDSREKAISLLKKLVEVIEKQFINLNLDIRENILNDFLSALKNYRIITIKLVENIDYFRQIFSYAMNKGKFHEKILMKKYGLLDDECVNNYKGNYLLKLKDDIDFLGKSKINGYKNIMKFSEKEDPFLLNISEIVPINKEDYSNIKQCQYIITQEMIFDKIINDKDNNKIIDNKDKKNIKEINNNKYQKKEKEQISCINKSSEKKNENNKIKKTEKIVIETQLIDKNNYEKFFGNNDLIEETSEEQTLLDLKKGYDIIHNFNKNKKQKIEAKDKEKNLDNLNLNKTEEVSIKKDEKEIINNKIEESIKIERENSIEKEDKKEKNEVKEELNENKNNKIEESLKKENSFIHIEENINVNQEKNKNKKTVEIESTPKIEPKNNNRTIPEEEVDITNTYKKSEEHMPKTEKKEIEPKLELKDKDNNDDIVNIQEKIDNTEQIKNKDNNIENNNNSLSQSKIQKKISRSLTPKSQRESKINNILTSNEVNKDNNQSNTDIFNTEKNINTDTISFYCGKLSDFISIYSTYYKRIPEEQKIIFNIKENIIEYIHNNFYPKIIIFGNKKNKEIKGLCIISHIFWKKNELYVEHISSYKNEEREKIFEMFFSFIKENSYKILGYDNNIKENDIYIDLYYKNEEGKFIINEEIKDYFKKKINFKWVKLVNVSKFERFIQMRHHFNINQGNNINLLNNEYDDNNVLNQSILGKKEFNNDELNNNNNSDMEKSEESNDDSNLNISTIFELNKEKNEKEVNNNLNIYKNKEPNLLNNFLVKNKTILKFNTKLYENKNNSVENIFYSNSLNFVYLLSKIYNINENRTLYNNISQNINSYFSSNDSPIVLQTLQKCNKIKNNTLIESSNFYSDISELNSQIKNKFKICININALLPFENCVSFIYNKYNYNRIKIPKLQMFKERFTQQIFYMITKNENHAVLISGNLSQNFKEKYLNENNKNNLSINFMNIYNNLSNVDIIENNILYIPAFELKSKYVNNCFNKEQSEKKYNLYCYEDYYNIKFLSEELTVNKNMKKNGIRKTEYVKMNFEYDLIEENDIKQNNFIKDDFLLIVFDFNIMEQLRDFPLLTLFVSKDNFIHI